MTLAPVDRHGHLDPGDLEAALRDDTLLVSVSHASGEIGTLQAIEDLARVAHARGVLFHTDATLTAGALPWPTGPDLPDLVTLTAHLCYGPQGIAALRVAPGVRLAALIEGGTQEGGLRAGTEPVATVAGFGAAARLAARDMGRRASRANTLAGRLRRGLMGSRAVGLVLGVCRGCVGLLLGRGLGHERLLRSFDLGAGRRFFFDEGKVVVQYLALVRCVGVALGFLQPRRDHVLEAIGVDPVSARGALTFMFGETNRDEDADVVAATLPRVVARLRELSPLR